MNSEFDPLEAELRSLRPRDPSPDLQQRIEGELLAQPPGCLWSAQPPTARVPRHHQPAYFAVAAAALVACLLAAAFFLRPDTRQTTILPPPLAESPAAAACDAALPSVWQFRHALNRSSADLDAALDQHSARAPAPAISFVQIRGLGRSDSNIDTLLGEL